MFVAMIAVGRNGLPQLSQKDAPNSLDLPHLVQKTGMIIPLHRASAAVNKAIELVDLSNQLVTAGTAKCVVR